MSNRSMGILKLSLVAASFGIGGLVAVEHYSTHSTKMHKAHDHVELAKLKVRLLCLREFLLLTELYRRTRENLSPRISHTSTVTSAHTSVQKLDSCVFATPTTIMGLRRESTSMPILQSISGRMYLRN
uniref:Uncharacterized protein n=1 Tax=Guillardia theta TaxID=55529 RepID=A0A7S4KY28_GUITH